MRAEVSGIDAAAARVMVEGRSLGNDRLVLAAGGRLVRAAVPSGEYVFNIDTAEGVTRLNARLRDVADSAGVVVGSGFTGLEIATELAGRGRVLLVERAGMVAPELGAGPRPVIEAALAELGVKVRCRVASSPRRWGRSPVTMPLLTFWGCRWPSSRRIRM